ncbi:TPA: WYL domain-containing protein [Vibrio cholerae]|nr:WYL domain-containing protein [Vibrio cholerae]EJL6691939.1 WYL domain-containing protein [Vibrio cholerae]EJX1709170.1 WYL domain-containing protein [Vibrio cholerae]HEJ2458926.1 WYL domain-containing protein [Vibrio cholerae]
MAKRASTQESLHIAFEILRHIPKTGQVTASEIHQKLLSLGLQRDLRTVQRTLDMLSQHFDIERDERAKPYGYRWSKHSNGFRLPKLSPSEALLLNLAEDYLANLLPANLAVSLESFFREAKHTLAPTASSQKEREWLKKVRVVSETQPLLAPKIDSAIFQAVSEALFHNRWLDIDYHNAKQEQKSATVMPLGLAQQGNRLYLVCRFDGYDNERTLALHRINKAMVSTFTFLRPPEFRLSQYDGDGRFSFGEGQYCQVQFNISKTAGFHLLETPLSSDQKVQEHDNHYQVCATVIHSKQLERWLNSFGEQVWAVEISCQPRKQLTEQV